jgi:hypothetical protein
VIDAGPPSIPNPRLLEYANLPRAIGTVVSRRMATLHELQSVYGAEDLYNMLEILVIDNYNERVLSKQGN